MNKKDKDALLAEIESIRLRYGLAGIVVYAWTPDRHGVIASASADGYEHATEYVALRMRGVIGDAAAIRAAADAGKN